jgi:DNA-binding PadR family transcriptional regulator
MAFEQTPEMKRLKTKTGIEVLWVYLLSLLKKKPSHAYVLRKKIKEKFDFLPGNVSVYVILYKLESRGFVKAKMDNTKKVYSITPKGKKLLQSAKKEWKSKLELL